MSNMVDFDIKLLAQGCDNQNVNIAINSLLRVLKKKTITVSSHEQYLEKNVLRHLVSNLLQHVATTVILERRCHNGWVESKFKGSNKVICGYLGMGNNESTWYGTVDGILRGHTPDSSTALIAREDANEDEVESNGASMVMEIKPEVKHRSQAIGSVVLSSFVEHNLHKDLNPLVPALLINCHTIQIHMYDCESDILLMSNEFTFRSVDDKVNKESILLLWLFINHRYVLKI